MRRMMMPVTTARTTAARRDVVRRVVGRRAVGRRAGMMRRVVRRRSAVRSMARRRLPVPLHVVCGRHHGLHHRRELIQLRDERRQSGGRRGRRGAATARTCKTIHQGFSVRFH